MAEFGQNIKQAREEKGMTQQALADRLFVTRQTISRWESGTRYPDLPTAKKLADILEIPLDDLLSGEDFEKVKKKIKRQKRKKRICFNLIWFLVWGTVFGILMKVNDSIWDREEVVSDPWSDMVEQVSRSGGTAAEITVLLDEDDLKIYAFSTEYVRIYVQSDTVAGEWSYGAEAYVDGVYYDSVFPVYPYHVQMIDTEGNIYEPFYEIESEEGFLPVFAFDVKARDADVNGICLTALLYGIEETGEIICEPCETEYEISEEIYENSYETGLRQVGYQTGSELAKTAAGTEFLAQYETWINNVRAEGEEEQDTKENQYLDQTFAATATWFPCYEIEYLKWSGGKNKISSFFYESQDKVTAAEREDGSCDVWDGKNYYIDVEKLTAAEEVTEELLLQVLSELQTDTYRGSSSDYDYLVEESEVYRAEMPEEFRECMAAAFEQ